MLRKALAIALIAVILFSPGLAAAQEYHVLESYVWDDANALYGFEEEDLEQLCGYVYELTGVQMAVIIVNTTAPDDIFTCTYETLKINTLGQEGKDNGLLFVMATDTQEWRVEVGYGLEGILPDARIGNLVETYLLPEVEIYGDYGTGIYNTMDAFATVIFDEYEDAEPPPDPYPISFIPLKTNELILAIIITVVLAIITKGRIIWFIPWIFSGGKIGGGGMSGGGGAGGKW